MRSRGVARPEYLSDEVLAALEGKASPMQVEAWDSVFMARVSNEMTLDEIYNLVGISSIALPWERPVLVGEVNGFSVGCMLELIRTNPPSVRVCAGAQQRDVWSQSG